MKDCVQLNAPNDTVYCAADILNVMQSILNAAGYFLGVATTCVDTSRLRVSCASNLVSIVGNAVEAAGALTGASVDCPLPAPGGAEGIVNATLEGSASDIAGNETGLTSLATGWCVLNSVDSAVYLAQAANNIKLAAGDCNKTNRDKLDTGAACASDVLGVLSSFSDVAGYLSGAAATCAQTLNLEAACGADIGSVLNGLFGVASGAAAAASNCRYLTLGPAYEPPYEPDPPLRPTVDGRRLTGIAALPKRSPELLYP